MTQGHQARCFIVTSSTHLILKGSIRLTVSDRVVHYDTRTPGAMFYFDISYTHLILKGSIRLALPGRVVYYDKRISGVRRSFSL